MESMPEISQRQLILEQLEHIDESRNGWQSEAAEGIQYLNENLGIRLTSYIFGAENVADLEELKQHPSKIDSCVAKKVCAVKSIFESVTEVDGSSIARHWFISMQPDLDDAAPAEVFKKSEDDEIIEDFKRVWSSANSFLGMGYS